MVGLDVDLLVDELTMRIPGVLMPDAPIEDVLRSVVELLDAMESAGLELRQVEGQLVVTCTLFCQGCGDEL